MESSKHGPERSLTHDGCAGVVNVRQRSFAWSTVAGSVLTLVGWPVAALAEEPSFDAVGLLTQAYYLQEGTKALDLVSQGLTGAPGAADIQGAADKFEASLNGAVAALKQKNLTVGVPDTPADHAAQLSQVKALLGQQKVDEARRLVQSVYAAALAPTYRALAEKYQSVAEKASDPWRYEGFINLAVVHLKQHDLAGAQQALWKGLSSSTALQQPDMEPALKFFSEIAMRIGNELIRDGEFATAQAHYKEMVNAWPIKDKEIPHAALGLVCVEVADTACAVENLKKGTEFETGLTAREVAAWLQRLLEQAATDPAAYSRVFRLAELWRQVVPGDDDLLKTAIATIQSRNEEAKLVEWCSKTADCGIKLYLVEALQRSSAEPYFEQAQAAYDCSRERPEAQRVLAVAYQRRAVQRWNEVARNPPKDADAAAAKIREINELLSHAEGASGADELKTKVERYAANWAAERRSAESRGSAQQGHCDHLYTRTTWTRDQGNPRVAEVWETLESLKRDKERCAALLGEAKAKELEAALPVLIETLDRRCKNEYYTLPDIPPNLDGVTKERADVLRAQMKGFFAACESHLGPVQVEKMRSRLQVLGDQAALPSASK